MKRVQALITYSLLGSVWLASCGGDNKKTAPPYQEAEGGEAGEATGPRAGAPSAGAGNRSGAGGSAGKDEPGVGGCACDPVYGEAGQGGQGPSGEGGEGGALACFPDLGEAGAPPDGVDLGTAGAGSKLHVSYNCKAALAALSPSYDVETGNIKLDASKLGPVAGGTFTYYYHYLQSDGETGTEDCSDDSVTVNAGGQLVLPLDVPSNVDTIDVSALLLHDQCGNEAELDPNGQPGTCFKLEFTNPNDTWQVDCHEGATDYCLPACGTITLPPTSGPSL